MIFRRIFSLLVLTLWLAACASSPTPSKNDLLIADLLIADLLIAVPGGAAAKPAAAYAVWFQQQTGLSVRVDRLSTDQYEDQVSAALLSSSDHYDLVYLSAESLGKWTAYHALQPVQALPTPQALKPWLDLVTIDGQVYGIPVQPDVTVLWYRADLLETAHLQPPVDWEAFRSAAKLLNHPADHYGAVIAGSDADSAYAFSAVLASFGGQAVNQANQLAIDEPAARRALELYAGLRTTDQVTPPGAENFSASEVLAALQRGKAAFGIAPLSAGDTLLDCKASPKVCTPQGKPLMAYTWIPGLPETTGTGKLSAWAIPLHAGRQKAAQAFLARLATPEGAKAWAGGGGIPANQAALQDAQVQAKIHGADHLARLDRYLLVVPPLSTGDQVLKAYHQAVHAAVAGTQTPAQALDQAAVEINKALRQGGY